MEFSEVVRRRHMVRRFDPGRPVEPADVDRILANAVRAPSAGFSQGWAFLVLTEPADVERFWVSTSVAGPGSSIESSWLRGMRTAPVLVVPLSSKAAYLDRYAEPDKAHTHRPGTERDAARWPVPFWDVDTGMAALLILQTVVEVGLGACFFAIPGERTDAFRGAFGVPATHRPIGAIAIGHPAPGGAAGSPARRARRTPDEVVHRGRWR